MQWKLNPVPTIHTEIALQQSSSLRTPASFRKHPSSRVYQPDELQSFNEKDEIKDLNHITEKHCFPGYQYHKTDNYIVMYNLHFNQAGFSSIDESIKIDKDLHGEFQYQGNPVSLPQWFREGKTATLTRFSMLQNFPSYLQTSAPKNSILNELQSRQNYKPQSRLPYSSEMIRLALLLRYTSLQSYKILLKHFPLPSVSLLAKLKSSSADAVTAAKLLRKKNAISEDVVLMADEMYLQKKAQYGGGDYVGADEDGNLCKGIMVFMICGLKKTIPIVVKASPETKLNGTWIAEK